jgi:hypothetical protein
MLMRIRGTIVPFLALAVVAGLAYSIGVGQPPKGQPKFEGQPGVDFPEIRVVESDGAHLIVTDQRTALLHFYAIDPDGKIGSPLKLRATIDLKEVGKPSITPMMPKQAEKPKSER